MKSLELKKCNGFGRKVIVFLAAGGGLGLSPVASGTAGTLPGLLIAAASFKLSWALTTSPAGVITIQIFIALILAIIAVPMCDIAETHFGNKDDKRIVADEFMTFPICVIGLPPGPAMFAIAFLTNRFFDILKPPPARGLQSIRGGKGIVIDDCISCIYSLGVNYGIYLMFFNHL